MIAIEPFTAMRQVWHSNPDGGMTGAWEPCRVLGITERDGEPVYVIEVYEDGESYLTTEETIKRPAP